MSNNAFDDRQPRWTEKRISQRSKWDYPIKLKLEKGSPIHGEIKNISSGGSYVVGSDMNLLEAGDICRFRLELADKDPTFIVEGKAEVARKMKSRAIGLRFVELNAASKIHLAQVLNFIG